MVTEAVGMGLIVSFIFTEVTGLSPGGLIVPGYLALFLDRVDRVVATFLVALITYGLVKLISSFIIIYSRRRFMLVILTGYLLRWLIETRLLTAIDLGSDFRVIGFIVPGLIANDMYRQGIVQTITTALVVAVIVRVIVFTLLF